MASTTAVMVGSSVVAAAPASLSSTSVFGSSCGVSSFAPVATRVNGARSVAVRASQSSNEEMKAARREVITGLFAAGALLASAPAFALSGPGGDGAERTAKKADELLNSADELTKKDSPPLFGKGGVQGAVQEAGSTAKQAGSGTAKNVQDVADAAVTNARDNLNKAKASFGDLMGTGK